MEISPRRSLSLDFDVSAASPAASSYPPTYANCRSNMYTMQGMKTTPESKILRPFGMSNSLSMDSGTTDVRSPKKENFLNSMFGTLTSIFAERFAKVPGSLMSNINNTLSVTVVPNEGIISQEFFKNLTRSYEQLSSEQQSRQKESMRMPERLPSKSSYDTKSQISRIFADNARTSKLPSKVSLNCEQNTIECKESKEEKSSAFTCPVEPDTEFDIKVGSDEELKNKDNICQVNTETMEVSGNEIIPVESAGCPLINSTEARTKVKEPCSSRSTVPKVPEDPGKEEVSEEAGTNRWQTMLLKVINGVTDHFNPRTESPDSEVPTKKPNLAKPRRKTCVVARGRGKGRGKSQLRRSGVSQSRHRKERTKHDICSNIQDDLEAWEDSERYDESGDEDLAEETSKNDEQQSSPRQESDCASSRHCSMLYMSFAFDKSSNERKRKQRPRNGSTKCPMRVRYVPESSMEFDMYGAGCMDECATRLNEFRPRLVSESSVDSEDSYCIVFENGSESEYTDYDYDTVSDDDLDEDDGTTVKVRFNLEPTVHTMVQWDYAYRAARRGPWEEMARDRERFRGRINCIGRILDPILSAQHRKCVWHERFDV